MEELEQLRRDREIKMLRNEAKYGKYVLCLQLLMFIVGLMMSSSFKWYGESSRVGELFCGVLLCTPLLIKLATKKRP